MTPHPPYIKRLMARLCKLRSKVDCSTKCSLQSSQGLALNLRSRDLHPYKKASLPLQKPRRPVQVLYFKYAHNSPLMRATFRFSRNSIRAAFAFSLTRLLAAFLYNRNLTGWER